MRGPALRVSDVMERDVQAARPEATLGEVIATFADGHVSGLPVVETNGQVVGVVTTTDLLEAEAEHSGKRERSLLFDQMLVRDIMTLGPKMISSDADLRTAAKRMLELEVHRLFVEEDGRLVGVLSQTDIVKAFAQDQL